MVDTNTITPSWLNKDFLTNVLQKEEPSTYIKVLSFNVKPAVAKGNNYACLLLRVRVEYEKNGKAAKISLIVKTPLSGGEMSKIMEEVGLIDRECLIYKEFLPIVNRLTNKAITPKDYYCPIQGTIILEDLSEQGYVMGNRLEQLDFHHCNIFMKVIGKFHALSLHIQKQKPLLVERIGKELIFHENLSPESKTFFLKGLHSFAMVLEEWEGFGHFSKFIKNNEATMCEKMVLIHNGKHKLRVLNHGDAWTNNMLFKYDESGQVVDLKLIDLQLSKLASPAVDLVNFIVSSAQTYVKEQRLPELYAAYLESFNSTLETVGCEERMSAEELDEEINFVEMAGLPLYLLPFYVPTVLCEKENVKDIQETMDLWNSSNGDGKDHIWRSLNGKHFKKSAIYTLKKMEQNGFITSF